MNELNIINGRMSTLAFAEMTGTRHDNVLEKAKKLLDALEIGHLNFQDSYLSSQNKELPMLSLDKDLSLTLAGQYEPKIAYHVAKAFNKPMSEIETARLYLHNLEELERQKALVVNSNAKVKELSITLDKEHHWSSIKRQEMIHTKKFSWRDLKHWHQVHGIEMKDVFDQNYGTVKSYSAEAWLEVYTIDISEK